MTPEDVIETEEQAGQEPASEPLPSDNGALEVLLPPEGGCSLLTSGSPSVPAIGQVLSPERSCDDEALDQVIEALPGVFTDMLACLEEDRKIAQRMHNHYAEISINNQAVDMATTADGLAKDYLSEMVKVDQEKASLVKTMSAVAAKRRTGGAKRPGKVNHMVVAGPGSQVNLFEKSRREVLQDLQQKRLEDKK